MARRNRRASDEAPRPLRSDLQQVEEHEDGDWHVRRVAGSSSGKTYRCPGCDQEVRPGTPHVVAWPAGTASGEEHRRHWHTPCWEARLRRGPRTSRGRGPRY
ncbi:MAG: ATP/GTP-binding protein [Actinobacteria bacterium]|nr:ATP/GTP-binding protein [Actinomycetota bacterium]